MCFEFRDPFVFHALVCCMALLIIAQCFFWVCWGYPGCCLGFPTSEHGCAMAVKRKRIKTGDGTTGFGPDSSALCTCHRFFGQQFRRDFCGCWVDFFLKNRIWSNKLWQKNDDTLYFFFVRDFSGSVLFFGGKISEIDHFLINFRFCGPLSSKSNLHVQVIQVMMPQMLCHPQ